MWVEGQEGWALGSPSKEGYDPEQGGLPRVSVSSSKIEGWIGSRVYLLSKGQASLLLICATSEKPSQTSGAKRKSLFCFPIFRAVHLAPPHTALKSRHHGPHLICILNFYTHYLDPVTGLCLLPTASHVVCLGRVHIPGGWLCSSQAYRQQAHTLRLAPESEGSSPPLDF